MILSNEKILEALDNGWLAITPLPQPRPVDGVVPENCPYQTSALDLRLGNEVTVFDDSTHSPITINLKNKKFLSAGISKTVVLTTEQPYCLKPGKLVLAKTAESVTLPIPPDSDTPCLAARVEGRSSFARYGLLVHFTAPTIHAGFSGTITLELITLGPFDIVLEPGVVICQLILEQVAGVPMRNDSQFQGQTKPGGHG